MTSTVSTRTARQLDLGDLTSHLKAEHARKIDVVIPASQLSYRLGQLEVKGVAPITEGEPEITLDGVTPAPSYPVDGLYHVTDVFDGHVAERFDIPPRYLRRLRNERIDMLDANVNSLIQGRRERRRAAPAWGEDGAPAPQGEKVWDAIGPDDRKFLLRLFRANDEGMQIARALMSDRYARLDNLDGLMSVLKGLQAAGLDPATLEIKGEISDRRMYLEVGAPEIKAAAPDLLKGYRNPFGVSEELGQARAAARWGRSIEDWRRIAEQEGMSYSEEEGGEPVLHAGFVFTNSEVGGGAWTIAPRIVVQVCKNGLVMEDNRFGRVHLGARLQEGVVQWSDETLKVSLDLVTKQTTDVVRATMRTEFVEGAIETLSDLAGVEVKKAPEVVKAMVKKLSFGEAAIDGILAHFIAGGQQSAMGIVNAVTSYSQTVLDADVAYELDRKAIAAGQFVAASV